MKMTVELKSLFGCWWNRGYGAATLMLLLVASVFRTPQDPIFWVAVLFFLGHLAMTLRDFYLSHKVRRATVSVTRTHATSPVLGTPPFYGGPPIVLRLPANSLFAHTDLHKFK